MGYKKFIGENHYVDDNIGNDILSGVKDGLKVGKALGLDKQAEKDIKRIKGYSDTEINEMGLTELSKECKKFHIKFIICAVCAVILVLTSLMNISENIGYIILGIIAGVISFRFHTQYKKLKAKIDGNNQ